MTGRKKRKKGGGAVVVSACIALILLVLVLVVWIKVWQPGKQKIVYPLLYQEELLAASEEFDIDPCMLAALVYTESSFQADAVSHVGAIGLMQIMPETGQWLSGKIELPKDFETQDLYDPETNLRLGCWYVRFLLDRYDGQWQEALTAYIAGQGQVDKWLRDPALSEDGRTLSVIPGQDVKEYAAKVLNYHENYKEGHPDVLVCTLGDDELDGVQK